MDADAERLKKAFADLGVSSQSDLRNTADAAARNFELITKAVSEGKAATEDAKRAFVAYAQAQLAAAKDSDASTQARVRNELAVKGATVGATDALVQLGLAGSAAGDQVATGAAKASSALSQVSSNASDAAANVSAAGEAIEQAGEAANASSGGFKTVTENMVAMSAEAGRALMSMNRLAAFPDLWRNGVNSITAEWRQQSEALAQVNAQLDEQLAAFDPLTAKVKALQQAYGYVDEATLRAIAEKQQRLEEQQKQADEAKKQADNAVAAANSAGVHTGPATAIGSAAASTPTASAGAFPPATKVIRLEIPGSGLPGVQIAVDVNDEAALEALLERLIAMLHSRRGVSVR
jgi:hypothetical protein